MELWHEYNYKVEDTTKDTDGNELMEITLLIKPVADRWDITEALSNFLETGLLKTGENK
jgi:hypothetical protein